MILSTHAFVGAAIASFLPSHPTTAFVLGFASHFVLDAIPHWDYPIRSAAVDPKIGAPMTCDRALLRDAVVIGSDGLLGILGALLLFASADRRQTGCPEGNGRKAGKNDFAIARRAEHAGVRAAEVGNRTTEGSS